MDETVNIEIPESTEHKHDYSLDHGNGVKGCPCGSRIITGGDFGKSLKETPSKPDAETPNKGGHPCDFCRDKDNLLKITQDYIDSGAGDKPKILYLIELALKLKKHRETIMNWANKRTEDNELEHPQFFDMIKTVEQMQELRLQQRILGRYNPSGAIFLLKTKHGYIETEKQILAGDKTSAPLQIVITEDKSAEES